MLCNKSSRFLWRITDCKRRDGIRKYKNLFRHEKVMTEILTIRIKHFFHFLIWQSEAFLFLNLVYSLLRLCDKPTQVAVKTLVHSLSRKKEIGRLYTKCYQNFEVNYIRSELLTLWFCQFWVRFLHRNSTFQGGLLFDAA